MSVIDAFVDLISRVKIIELSHPLEEGMTAAPGHNYFYHMLWNSYDLGEAATSYQCILNEHSGTHVDAPAHFMNKDTKRQVWIDQVPIKNFMGSCSVIKMEKMHGGDEVSVEDIKKTESIQGDVQKGEGVLFCTGWGKNWSKRPNDETFRTSWPGLSRGAAEYLAGKEIAFVGTDALSIDSSKAEKFPAHNILLGKKILIFENLKNLDKIDGRCFLMALPLLIRNGSASPVRVVAFVEDE